MSSFDVPGILRADPEPGFYAYRMGYHDVDGNSRQIAGVLGALELVAPGEGDVLPHEETQSKVRDDRLRPSRVHAEDERRERLDHLGEAAAAEALVVLGPADQPVIRGYLQEGEQPPARIRILLQRRPAVVAKARDRRRHQRVPGRRCGPSTL